MRFNPSDRLDWLVSYDRYQDNGAGMISLKDCEKAAGTFFACDHDQWFARINVPGEIDMTIDSYRSELQFDISDSVVLEHRVGFSRQERYQAYDGDGGAFADPDHPAYGIGRDCCGANFGPIVTDAAAITAAGFDIYNILPWEDLQLTTRDSHYESIVTELQLKSTSDAQLQWVAGLFYMEENNDIRFDVELQAFVFAR